MAAAFACFASAPATASCSGDQWNGGSGGDWETGTNWSTGTPTSTTDVCIANGTADLSATELGSVADLTLFSGTGLDIGGELDVFGSSVSNAGTIQLNGGTLAFDDSVTLNGGGTVVMSGSSGIDAYNGTPNLTLNNVDNTIEGWGEIGQSGLALNNESGGTVDANGSGSAQVLALYAGNNAGLLEATGNGTLDIDGIITNSGNITANGAGSTVNIESEIDGGTLNTIGGGIMQTDGSATLNGITLSAGSTYTSGGNTTFDGNTTNNGFIDVTGGTTFLEGTLTNNNTIDVSGGTLAIGGGTVTLTGGQTFLSGSAELSVGSASTLFLTGANTLLSGPVAYDNAGLIEVENQAVFFAEGGTISGGGTIQIGSGRAFDFSFGTNVDNTIEGGTIDADFATNDGGGTIVLQGGTLVASQLDNEGLIKVSGPGTNIETGVIDNTGNGSIAMINSAVLELENGGFIGGDVTGTGLISVSGIGKLENVALASGIDFVNGPGDALVLGGTITSNGTIDDEGSASTSGDVTLAGSGTLLLAGGSLNEPQSGSGTLTNAGNTIEGFGQLANLVNESGGTVLANFGGQTLELDGTVTNYGAFQVSAGATMDATGAFTNGGALLIHSGGTFTTGSNDYNQSGGTAQVDGTLSAANANINGGELEGTGEVAANLFNYGTVRPGDPGGVGTLSVSGNFAQGAAATLEIDIAGASAGQYGQLIVSGKSSLAGTLALLEISGFKFASGEIFDLINSGNGHTGDFSALTLNGTGCAAGGSDVWNCGNISFDEMFVPGDELELEAEIPQNAPEPGSLLILVSGLGAASALRRLRRRARARSGQVCSTSPVKLRENPRIHGVM